MCVCDKQVSTNYHQLIFPSTTVPYPSTHRSAHPIHIHRLLYLASSIKSRASSLGDSTLSAVILLSCQGLPLHVPHTRNMKEYTRFRDIRDRTYPHVSDYYFSILVNKAAASCLVASFIYSPVNSFTENTAPPVLVTPLFLR